MPRITHLNIERDEMMTPERAEQFREQVLAHEKRSIEHGAISDLHSCKVQGSIVTTLRYASTDVRMFEAWFEHEREHIHAMDLLAGRTRLPGQEDSTNNTPSGMLTGIYEDE